MANQEPKRHNATFVDYGKIQGETIFEIEREINRNSKIWVKQSKPFCFWQNDYSLSKNKNGNDKLASMNVDARLTNRVSRIG